METENNMKRVACVILNYNDSGTTVKLLNLIQNYTVFEMIVVVDNNSTDNSLEVLKEYETDKVAVIRSQKNGGYGYGNNCGIRHAEERGFDYALVANPDVVFKEKDIVDCLDIISANDDVAAIAPRIKNGIAFKIAPPLLDITYSSLLLNKIFKPRYYPSSYYDNDSGMVYVDALPGSLVLFDIRKFSEVGMYDENVFLYNEELIIGKKFLDRGYKTVLNLNDEYLHMHGVSVNKTFRGSLKPNRIARQSQKYYLKEYLKANKAVLVMMDVLWPIQVVELFVWRKLKPLFDR